MQQTLSATPLEAVHVEQRGDIADVWLHRNIVHDWHDLPDGCSQEFWSADEVYGTMPAGTTKAQVEANFDRLWLRFDSTGLTDREYAERTAQASMQAASSVIAQTTADYGYDCAPDNINAGELFVAGGAAYVALENLARGERLRDGNNVRKTTVAAYVTELAKEA